jgi:dihydrofolate synthase/folylpolyglutamate synthase
MLKENIEYIEGLKRFGMKFDLSNMERICSVLGNPHKDFKSVHVGGTNGKGSTSTLIANVLRESEYKTGLYTSPYIIEFNERIKINNKMIKNSMLDSLISEMRELFSKEKIIITFFEFTTALAFLYFSREKVDIAVIEVGLGGLLDSTNIIDSEISVITNIGLDHCSYLGKTKQDIAKKKAGIIKQNQVCITSEKDLEIRKYFSKVCNDLGSKLVYARDLFDISKVEIDLNGMKFNISGYYEEQFNMKLLGKHQIDNVLNSLITVNELKNKSGFYKISRDSIRRGIENTYLSGRMQIVSKKPLIIVDAAHNISGIKVLNDFISSLNSYNFRNIIVGIAKDKDHEEMIKRIVPKFDKVITTEGRFKPLESDKLVKIARKYSNNVNSIKSVREALDEALENVRDNDLILITGSIYMIGEALKVLKGRYLITSKLQQSL